jgi:hypothetical protein
MNPLEHLAKEVLGSAIASVFDPRPIVFKASDEAGIGPVRTGCRKPDGALHTFRSQLNRNAFLMGCHEFACEADVEHLIVGFGFKHGSTTVVEQMAHAVGTKDAVSIPTHIASAVEGYVKQQHANEVLLFHNHPRNVLNVVVNSGPLPSSTDRRTLVSFHRDAVVLGKTLMGGGCVKFYVGENYVLREFHTPDLLPLIEQVLSSVTPRQV